MAISPNQYRIEFIATEAAREIKEQLVRMESDPAYMTKSTYSPLSDGDNGDVTFADKHFKYLSTHPAVNPRVYMANLRLMTKLSNRSR